MNTEILQIAEQMKDAYEGDPWFGRNAKTLLSEISEEMAFQKPSRQHSILELVWHMVNWKEFVISRLVDEKRDDLAQFEENDWRELNHSDSDLWSQGLERFNKAYKQLLELVMKQNDALLSRPVHGRNYTFRKLLYGSVQHDIYHLGQIAYVKKLLAGN
jgi:uncharacterized damage-inducible protein DinB